MSPPNDTAISSSSSWLPYIPPSAPEHDTASDLEAGAREVDGDSPESSYFHPNPAGSSFSTRPATPKLTMTRDAFNRPSLGRSATTPHFRKRTSTLPRLGSQTPREWSLFGQLMENDGQITPKSASFRRARRGPSTRSPSGDTTPRGSMLDSYASVDVSSPVAEEEFFAERTLADPDSDSESDASSESDESSHTSTTVEDEEPPSRWYSLRHRIPSIPILYRNIFKCAIAYFIASLFTFNPYLSGFISDMVSYGSGERKPLPSGHMVATVAVYFNPAKTMGGMIEADFYCIFGVVYSAFICLSSMTMFWWLDVQPGWEWLADVLAITWVGVGMSFLAWMKVYMANPQFNTACSMMAILIFVVLVKEGGLETLLQVAFIVFCGSLISNLVCYLIWPQSATDTLRSNMTKTLDSFSTLLGMLTDTFLLEEPVHHRSQGRIQRAVEAHQSSFTGLKKNLKEASSEWIFIGRLRTPSTDSAFARLSRGGRPIRDTNNDGGRKRAYEDAVDSLNRLAQHLNGLRSGTRLQFELTRAGVVERKARRSKKSNGTTASRTEQLVDVPLPEEDDEEVAMLKAAAVMFGDLVDDLGPPMKALSTTCTSGLKRLRESFAHHRDGHSSQFRFSEFNELIEGIEGALLRFESTSNHAVMRLYRKSDLFQLSGFPAHDRDSLPSTPTSARERPNTVLSMAKSDNAFLAGGDGTEHVFLVYLNLHREMTMLVDAMERIYAVEEERLTWGRWWGRVFNAVKGWWSTRKAKRRGQYNPKKAVVFGEEFPRTPRPSFPKVTPHAPDTIQTPSRKNLTFIGRIKQGMWSLGKRLNERDTKFAVKVGMATAILAAPAFFDSTRAVFVKYQGDWALISFFVVMSPTIGATNSLGLHLWAAVAAGIFTLFSDNAIVLSIFGFFFSIPCFYYLVSQPMYASSARFVLLTYNLTCLYCYNLRQVDLSVGDVAYHRALAVTVGVVWAALISRFWWPAEARRELSKALGEFCLNVGWLYTRLVMSNSYTPVYVDEDEENDSSSGPSPPATTNHSPERPKTNSSIKEFMAMWGNFICRSSSLSCKVSSVKHNMNLVCGVLQHERNGIRQSVREDFIIPVNKERRDMVGNIILYFSTLASAFRLKAPLPPYLPPAEESRQQLVHAIRKLEVVRNRNVKGSKQLLFFAYAMAMKGVTQELQSLGRVLQDAFGVIGQSADEFDALFAEDQRRRTNYIA
ncbi:hypothetical protein BT96DRAFT_990562 [Gymnopus androsaceus JB14]|uniref:DUF2421 domain-containing protein n=1 Tax=Gymnopus androsaceus JB14 TaxID=1447944 RepID=A0A6A4HZ94_9AGAR|nr:hypothetical protein BT96DRAFT_990562 [Gymnopus androsaceus JB14]